MIGSFHPQLDVDALRRGESAYWVAGQSVEVEERTMDIT